MGDKGDDLYEEFERCGYGGISKTKMVSYLNHRGWYKSKIGAKKHDIYKKGPRKVPVPRHNTLKPGTARQIVATVEDEREANEESTTEK